MTDIVGVFPAGHDVFGNADLFHVFLAGIIVVAVHYDGRILQISFAVHVRHFPKVFIVVVRHAGAEVVHVAPEDGMGQWVAGGMYFPAVEEEILLALCRFDGVHHDRQVTGGGVLHAYRNAGAAGNHAVELVFYGTGADGAVGEKIRQVSMIFRIEDFFSTGEARFFNDMDMHAADGLDAFHHVFLALRIRLVKHAFVAFADGSRFVGVYAGHDEEAVFYFFRHFGKAAAVVQHRRLIVSRAGADNQEETIVLPSHNVSDFLVSFFLQFLKFCSQRDFLFDFHRFRKLPDELHLFHRFHPSLWSILSILNTLIVSTSGQQKMALPFSCPGWGISPP